MKLTAENVHKLMRECISDDESLPLVRGVICAARFKPEKLKEHEDEIRSMLAELPEQFQKSVGGGWSFLNACMTKDGDQWGEHRTIDELILLGTAIGRVTIQFPRSMWPSLPGGMPYFMVDDKAEVVSE